MRGITKFFALSLTAHAAAVLAYGGLGLSVPSEPVAIEVMRIGSGGGSMVKACGRGSKGYADVHENNDVHSVKRASFRPPCIKDAVKGTKQVADTRADAPSNVDAVPDMDTVKQAVDVCEPVPVQPVQASGTGNAMQAQTASASPGGSYGSGGIQPSNADGDGSGKSGCGTGEGGEGLYTGFGDKDGPRILRLVRPRYPEGARRRSIDGTVSLVLNIGEDGSVSGVSVAKPAGHGFDEAAVESVKRSEFAPASIGGRPVACRAFLNIRFEMENGG